MHIELTDHLRCPAQHDESFLVLLPSTMEGRRVTRGELGCPVCEWATQWENAVPDFGGGVAVTEAPPCDADGVLTLLGVEGEGGWIALAGTMTALAPEIAAQLPGVGVVAVNPPLSVEPVGGIQVIRSGAWPLKQQALRGLAIGGGPSLWVEQAIGSVLPGLRAVGAGPAPAESSRRELIAEAGALWVVRCR